jgi:hypothetical protein
MAFWRARGTRNVVLMWLVSILSSHDAALPGTDG